MAESEGSIPARELPERDQVRLDGLLRTRGRTLADLDSCRAASTRALLERFWAFGRARNRLDRYGAVHGDTWLRLPEQMRADMDEFLREWWAVDRSNDLASRWGAVFADHAARLDESDPPEASMVVDVVAEFLAGQRSIEESWWMCLDYLTGVVLDLWLKAWDRARAGVFEYRWDASYIAEQAAVGEHCPWWELLADWLANDCDYAASPPEASLAQEECRAQGEQLGREATRFDRTDFSSAGAPPELDWPNLPTR